MSEKAPLRVLVADDSQTARTLLRRQIHQHTPDATIEECADGADALECFTRFRPDVTFLDYNMPIMSGVDALRAIRKIDRNAFVALVTSDRTRERVQEALSLGVSGYIAKPFTAGDIAVALDRSREAEPVLSVLLADDARTHRAIMTRLLLGLGRQIFVEEAVDGEAACRRFEKNPHDVVLLDVNMPHMNGIEALKTIKAKSPSTKVVMISANRDEETITECRGLGADGFLCKPITAEALKRAVCETPDDSVMVG